VEQEPGSLGDAHGVGDYNKDRPVIVNCDCIAARHQCMGRRIHSSWISVRNGSVIKCTHHSGATECWRQRAVVHALLL
jgi:hypothetical protein